MKKGLRHDFTYQCGSEGSTKGSPRHEGDPSAPALALSLTRASLANALGLSILIHKMGITIQLHLPCRIVLGLKKTHHQIPVSSQFPRNIEPEGGWQVGKKEYLALSISQQILQEMELKSEK